MGGGEGGEGGFGVGDGGGGELGGDGGGEGLMHENSRLPLLPQSVAVLGQ
jgi:hypothetical protein